MSADPPRNFLISTEERIRALTIGVPAYAARKRHIEDLVDRFVATLVEAHDVLVAKGALVEIEAALLARARAFDRKKLDRLVDAHNRYYPIEANLSIDRATGDYLLGGRRWLPEAPWTPERLVASAQSALAKR
ncbi:MAG: hypothetical protein KF819_04895 [Labilithrix sp.]|nr:hypothetical protein [Labilithrix sp.]